MKEFEDMIDTIQLGDCYELIKKIPDKSIDLIIIDPPYKFSTLGGQGITSLRKMFDEIEEQKLNVGIDEKLFEELKRVMKEFNIYIWCNKTMIPKLIEYFVLKNECLMDIISWHKTNAMPLCGGTYMPDTEYCLYFKKNRKLNTNYDTAKTHYELPINIEDKKKYKHPTIKPLKIIKNFIINSSNENDIVLDCFCGSGTTCVACKELGRRYIGIEINEKYHKIATDRLNGINANGQVGFMFDEKGDLL